MNDLFLKRLCKQTGISDISEALAVRLSASDLSALLLEVFHRKVQKITPPDLLVAYCQNRFVEPSEVDAIAFRAFELQWLLAGRETGFLPLELSPVGPLGSCSVVGTVHQHKVLSALRGTEIVADCTNILALEASRRRQATGFATEPTLLCAAHRHLRTQQIHVPGFTAHFGVFCLATAGRDTGSFLFEKTSLCHHIGFYLNMLQVTIERPRLVIVLKGLDPVTGPNRMFDAVVDHVHSQFPETRIEEHRFPQEQQQYYRALQFGIVLEYKKNRYPIIDGGFTTWTQQLTGNRKERFVASAIGLEFLWKLLAGTI